MKEIVNFSSLLAISRLIGEGWDLEVDEDSDLIYPHVSDRFCIM